MIRLGTDTGGTFTDFVWLDTHGRFQIHKQLSTPHDPSQSILEVIEQLAIPADAEIVHGSTVATNALLERKGARTALITTAGFADVLAIGRQNRPELYALVPQKSPALVPSRWRFEAHERITADGAVQLPLDLDDLEPVLEQLAADGIESIAICLLFSFLYPNHELAIRRLLLEHQKLRGVHISLSSEILPVYREYERTATTVINAYVAPLMSGYLSKLASGLGDRHLTVMQSNGGTIDATMAAKQAARTVLSGPAGGVVGARFVAGRAGYEDLVTFDMGGTSTDVALCQSSLPTTFTGEIAGLPLRLPIIDIHTVGAGGGSLAYVDAGGALHVGPQSAGADPGPACYGKKDGNWRFIVQGREIPFRVTTTDANLILGRLDADHFLGGRMRLDVSRAEDALRELAQKMSVSSIYEAAAGVIQLANANMERAIRRISIERGHDPRRFILLAFGGAGPLHACELAQNLGIPQVLVPTVPGVLSALGMLAALPTKDYSQTVMRQVGDDELIEIKQLERDFEPLVERAKQEMAQEGHDPDQLELIKSIDVRYLGQSHELTIHFQSKGISNAFHEAHEIRYGYHWQEAAIEIVTVRLTAVAQVVQPQLQRSNGQPSPAHEALLGKKRVWFNERMISSGLYERSRLKAGHYFSGPAVVFQYDTTTIIPPGWDAVVDAYANLVLANHTP
ncbi:MAG: hydantoinase/oxoprolinase family protein [Candidatus Promineifilaceae bacterium]|nr:hydantoinase/oxoprolinase family protein [Candidatus Promineifilaceae bacterium]